MKRAYDGVIVRARLDAQQLLASRITETCPPRRP